MGNSESPCYTFRDPSAFFAQIHHGPDGRQVIWREPLPPNLVGATRVGEHLWSTPTSHEIAKLIRSLPGAPVPAVPPQSGTSFGFGDRLQGFGTRAHTVAASRHPSIFPVFAQQSVLENTRLGRTPQQVMDDTTFALIEMNWKGPWGADADLLQTTEDVKAFAEAGFTIFTCDPSDHVVGDVDQSKPISLAHVCWDALKISPHAASRLWLRKETFDKLSSARMTLWYSSHTGYSMDPQKIRHAMARYGNAMAHVRKMYQQARRSTKGAFVFELSLSRLAEPTTPEEHLLISELCAQLDIKLWSFAPRFVGNFYEGVDYQPSTEQPSMVWQTHLGSWNENFPTCLAIHQGLASAGGYKLSIHSASDKFGIYPDLVRYCPRNIHLKTSGTSFLAAIQTIALSDSELFEDIIQLALEWFPEAAKSYGVRICPAKLPCLGDLRPEEYQTLVFNYHVRQILYVTYGEIMRKFGSKVLALLSEEEALHRDLLSTHLTRHLRPFART